MSGGIRLGLGVLGAALILGMLGDLLLRATPWGIIFVLWMVAAIVMAVALAVWGRVGPAAEGLWLIPVALVFAAGVAWRATPVVVALDVLAAVAAISLAAYWGRRGALRRAGVCEYAVGWIYTGAAALLGPIPVAVKDIRWGDLGRRGWRGPLAATARGALIAAPLLLIFGGLFAAADATFESVVKDLFGLDPDVVSHLLLILTVAWLVAGALWVALLASPQRPSLPDGPGPLSLGIVELGIVLGLLDALFLAFVAIQARYFFGGTQRLALLELTYAEYARRGFFELLAVAGLVVPLLLVLHWLFRAESAAQVRMFRALAGAMVTLVFVIMASALHRMYLYMQEFGLTVPRYSATVFMVWIAAVLLWLTITVLAGRRERFAFGALLAGFATVLFLNVLSPDAVVARVNIERAESRERFDPHYLASLSADAAPAIFEAPPAVGSAALGRDLTLERAFYDKYRNGRPPDWRSWNASRAVARKLAETG